MKKAALSIFAIAIMALCSTSVATAENQNDSEQGLQMSNKQPVIATYDASIDALVLNINAQIAHQGTLKITNSRGFVYRQETLDLEAGPQVIHIPMNSFKKGTFHLAVYSKSLKFSKVITKP